VDTAGAWVYLRDLVEALSQRWNRYVVGYDLRTQVRLFEDISRRYEALRVRSGVNRGPLDKMTRAPALAAATLVAFGVLYALWKRRRRPTTAGPPGDGPKVDPKLETATALYRALEAALSSHGITRPASLPPLRHAEDLRDRKHPLAGDVVELTHRYLETRFGHGELTETGKREFERRIRDIRAYRPPPRPFAHPAGQG
jgi:hypothetical protein